MTLSYTLTHNDGYNLPYSLTGESSDVLKLPFRFAGAKQGQAWTTQTYLAKPVIGANALAGATVTKFEIDGQTVPASPGTGADAGKFTGTVPAPLTTGTYQVKITGTDPDGKSYTLTGTLLVQAYSGLLRKDGSALLRKSGGGQRVHADGKLV